MSLPQGNFHFLIILCYWLNYSSYKVSTSSWKKLIRGYSPILKSSISLYKALPEPATVSEEPFYWVNKLEKACLCVPATLPTTGSSCEDGSYQAEESWFWGTLEEFEECNLPLRMRKTFGMRKQRKSTPLMRNRNHPLVKLFRYFCGSSCEFSQLCPHTHTQYGGQEDRARTNSAVQPSTWAQ